MVKRPFRAVLVANRGEIAIRVFRACNELGLRTLGIYSNEDKTALHRYKADETYLVGEGKAPLQAYLGIEEILTVAKRRGADAIHPGYGFLSENPAFARACEEAGIVFIGPPSSILEQMGDKVAARERAQALGIPVIPGTPEPLPDEDAAVAAAEAIGFPVILKASFGGGGRGMRVAHDARAPRSSSRRPRRRRPRRSAGARSSWRSTWSGRATSRCRCSGTRTGTSSTSSSATAPCSAATRR